ncbi:DUF4402 domain-containing protein [Novosphingobium sp. ZN18A2]|uniref:DUF4402 domain-containing protein n=1 Tax=Novosphingobium sp. ZN18A2 TaxID=3079861 RepID=UPI0030D05DF4
MKAEKIDAIRALAAAAIIAGAVPTSVASAQEASARGRVSAIVVRPLSVTRTGDLDFGTVAATGKGGGTVRVAPFARAARFAGSARQADCGTDAACGAVHAASFLVTGEPGRRYRVRLPAEATARDPRNPALALKVVALAARARSAVDRIGEGQLDGAGSDRLQIGGTLVVPPFTKAGHFTARIAVLIDYD